MNKVILMGRLTRDPEVNRKDKTAVARYTLAVDRRFKKDGEASADFINCVTFNGSAEFAEKYFRKGMRVTVCGRIQTGSYTNKDGVKVYTTDVVVEEQEFAQSRNEGDNHQATSSNCAPADSQPANTSEDGFLNIPDGLDGELPFN